MHYLDDVANEVAEAIEATQTITIVTHLNPDADTLGTGLGIYNLLKRYTQKRVEIVNASGALPHYLDFLPSYEKIKPKPSFEEGLVIGCDCGSIDRFGLDLSGREIINIDHHESNTGYGSVNVVMAKYASASQVAYRLFAKLYAITPEAATCFYTALLADTRYFTTASVNHEVFQVAAELVALGAEPDVIATHFTQRRSLASLRILERALSSLTLYQEGRIAFLYVGEDDIAATGATMPDMDGIADYGRSLAVVDIAVFMIETSPGEIRVSLRSKGIDLTKVASHFGGGGHKVASGFTLSGMNKEKIIEEIIEEISKQGLLDGKA